MLPLLVAVPPISITISIHRSKQAATHSQHRTTQVHTRMCTTPASRVPLVCTCAPALPCAACAEFTQHVTHASIYNRLRSSHPCLNQLVRFPVRAMARDAPRGVVHMDAWARLLLLRSARRARVESSPRLDPVPIRLAPRLLERCPKSTRTRDKRRAGVSNCAN